ncbi:hypothetical protein D623_10010580 [Myotis brandtii]|uniref:Uncharacterized protein n=1 Tax=Myotis brandtii TaxID=109478 RepID=S7NP63_MYOBR|nr:hypothetical protein D623_10010580 [Myotis brandtii]
MSEAGRSTRARAGDSGQGPKKSVPRSQLSRQHEGGIVPERLRLGSKEPAGRPLPGNAGRRRVLTAWCLLAKRQAWSRDSGSTGGAWSGGARLKGRPYWPALGSQAGTASPGSRRKKQAREGE